MHDVSQYRSTTNPSRRRAIEAEVMKVYRPAIIALARRIVPQKHLEEGEQVAAIGLWCALQFYRPSIGSFRSYALKKARDEVAIWLGRSLPDADLKRLVGRFVRASQ
jgi:hypothetical protein